MIKSMDNELAGIVSEYGLEGVPEIWFGTWRQSLADFPEDNDVWFVEEEYLLEANSLLKLSDDSLKSISEVMGSIRENNSLCKLAWHYSKLMLSDNYGSEGFCFPGSAGRLKQEFNGLFEVVILLSGLKDVVQKHCDRGIPSEITADTLSDLKLWMDHYYNKNGKWGMEVTYWLLNHFVGKLYRLGRLQFIHAAFQGNLQVFKNKKDGRTLAFSEPGIRYRSDGQTDGTSGVYDSSGGWISQLFKNEDSIKGNVISTYGYAEKKITEIWANEWETVLSKGDPVLEIHIPEGGKMSHDLCGESLNQAMQFFPAYFPEKKFKAFVCTTWLFDSQLQEILPRDSNIVRFQREFYLYPIHGSDFQIFERVFGGRPEDLSKAPRDSGLRRAVLDFAMSGRHFRDAGGFILAEDLNWGKELYIS